MVALTGAWWLAGGTLGPPGVATVGLGHATPADPTGVTPLGLAPTVEVIALADAAHLSEEGRHVFYGARPEILEDQDFIGRCGGFDDAEGAPGGAVGCYQQATNAIILYEPADPRLTPQVVDSAAHEMLHAAWVHLTAEDQAHLHALLEAEVAAIPSTDSIHQQIAGSVGSHAESRPTELFAYVGTQVWRAGGLAPELEATYARFIADRAALVAGHEGLEALLSGMQAEIDAASQAASARDLATAKDRLAYQGVVASFTFYEQEYDAKRAELAAMPAAQRQALQLSWHWWDGTELPMAPADETLARAAALLVRHQAELAARDAAITAAEDASAAERTRIQALVTELQTLHDQRLPGPAAS